MLSLIRNKLDSTVNQMQPLSPVILIKGNQGRPLTVFDHTFDVRKSVFLCSVICTTRHPDTILAYIIILSIGVWAGLRGGRTQFLMNIQNGEE